MCPVHEGDELEKQQGTTGTVTMESTSGMEAFVQKHGGHTVIERVLIANNGIAAVKAIRSIRKWAYDTFGNDRAIEMVVMATPDDMEANAEFIRMSDRYVKVPGGPNHHNYANVRLIVDVAERTQSQVRQCHRCRSNRVAIKRADRLFGQVGGMHQKTPSYRRLFASAALPSSDRLHLPCTHWAIKFQPLLSPNPPMYQRYHGVAPVSRYPRHPPRQGTKNTSLYPKNYLPRQ